jgi:tetratricopeptide (TPR) repeat protein
LLKVASVIGRNFFYKILTNVSASIEDLDGKLDFLKEIQLIMEGRRMDELEYLFKHALAQEAVYNSILLKKRRELHHSVGMAIESVFQNRLNEFYGLLAYHFSLAENLDKAEEYLIKAGEEALKSSASSEALHYFQEGLSIYLGKYGEDSDPEKVAEIEKNIALACFTKGELAEAIKYFDRVLAHFGERPPEKTMRTLFKFLSGFLNFLVCLYFPWLIKNKEPSQQDKDIIGLYEKKIRALAVVNPKRMFVEIFLWMRRLTHSDLSKVDNGYGLFVLSSGVFCYSGISFVLSRKILEQTKEKIDETNQISMLYLRLSEVQHNILEGSREKLADYDEGLLEEALRKGDLWAVSAYCAWYGVLYATLGDYEASQNIIDRLDFNRTMYEDEFSRTMSYTVKIKQLWKLRKVNEVLAQVNSAIKHFKHMGYPPYLCYSHSYKAQLELIRGETDEAEDSLQMAENYILEGQPAPFLYMKFILVKMALYIQKLEQAKKDSDRKEFNRVWKESKKTARRADRLSRKVSVEFLETQLKLGTLYWLRGKQNKALQHWSKSIEHGKKYDEKPELSRTYFEVGRRLFEDGSRYSELDGIKAVQYLEEAKTLFKEIGSGWDLEEAGKVESNLKANV